MFLILILNSLGLVPVTFGHECMSGVGVLLLWEWRMYERLLVDVATCKSCLIARTHGVGVLLLLSIGVCFCI